MTATFSLYDAHVYRDILLSNIRHSGHNSMAFILPTLPVLYPCDHFPCRVLLEFHILRRVLTPFRLHDDVVSAILFPARGPGSPSALMVLFPPHLPSVARQEGT